MSDYQTIAVIIPAAGVGKRMQSATPKQFLNVGGKTILAHTVDKFHQWAATYGHHIVIMVALCQGETLPDDVDNVAVCEGGETRADSVDYAMTALHQVVQFDWVLVHDAARPLVSPSDIETLFQTLKNDNVGGILAEKITATVKRVSDDKIVETLPRENLYLAQTPQMFRFDLLSDALSAERSHFTDEAAAIEALGYQPKVVTGSAENIKITNPEDLRFFERMLSQQSASCEKVNETSSENHKENGND